MDIPKVSICIPAYNNAAEVKRLLESICMQTSPPDSTPQSFS